MSYETEIIDVLCGISERRTMKNFLHELLTPAEIQDVALRWRLMQLLNQGMAQRTIAEKLGVSLCKITRGSKILKQNRSVSKKLLNPTAGEKNALRQKIKRKSRIMMVILVNTADVLSPNL